MVMAQLTSYLVCGYHVPATTGTNSDRCPLCLLYNETKKTFKINSLPPNKKGGAFRTAFTDSSPPFPYTWVTENVFSTRLEQLNKPAVDPESLLVTEDVIDTKIFKDLTIQSNLSVILPNILQQEMTEQHCLLNAVFTKGFIQSLRTNLIAQFKLVATEPHKDVYKPTHISHLFIHFSPVDERGGYEQYPYGPEYVILRHKLIKYVLQSICPFIRVALFDNLKLEQALSVCLPQGSAGKGLEIYCPSTDTATDTVSDLDQQAPSTSTNPVDFFQWAHLAVGDNTSVIPNTHNEDWNDTNVSSGYYHDPATQEAFINSTKRDEESLKFYTSGAVVFSTCTHNTLPFVTLDFTNYYANVAIVFNLDPYISAVLQRLTTRRKTHPELKLWIVALIGKAKHMDRVFYRRLKELSVAVMLTTILNQRDIILGATTDGFMVKYTALPVLFAYPKCFPIKVEFMPRAQPNVMMIHSGPNTMVGIDSTGSVHHRGIIGRTPGGYPAFYMQLVDILVKYCLQARFQSQEEATVALEAELIGVMKQQTPIKYALTDTGRRPSPINVKTTVLDYLCSEMCVGINQFFALIGDNIVSTAMLATTSTPLPKTQSGWTIKQFNVDKYIEVIEDKFKRCARLFGESIKLSMCEQASSVVTQHIRKTLPKATAEFPGGLL